MNMHVPALQRSLSDVVAEYDKKLSEIEGALAAFQRAGDELKMASTVAGAWGDVHIDVGRVGERELKMNLLKSAWKHVHDGLNISTLSSPTDKRLWEQALSNPQPFTLDNIRGTFGRFILDPRGNILRGLAEVFCGLDQAYKSHDKVKIGVKGLPKRIVLGACGRYSTYGRDKVQSILNALAAYQGKPLVTWRELSALMDGNEDVLRVAGELPVNRTWSEPERTPGRGIRLRLFANGNGHLFFDPDTLVDINKALAEFYGDVLPDTTEEKPTKKQPGTAVSKDLQYYPTPLAVVKRIIDDYSRPTFEGKSVLEPSCGCGRFLDALRKMGAKVYGIEVDATRAAHSRSKGHSVLHANFLDTAADPRFDFVIMNPPFYGTHYAQHVLHAFKFLRPGGTLKAILPITAREHGLLDEIVPKARWSSPWDDLPVGSFAESGTNINTTVLTVHRPEKEA